jgi:hypothetical protein
VRPTRRWRAKQAATQSHKPDVASPGPKIDSRWDDLSTLQAASDLAIFKHLFIRRQDRHDGLTSLVNQPGNSCLYMGRQKLGGNEEYQNLLQEGGRSP